MSFAPRHVLVAIPQSGKDADEIAASLVDVACDVAKPHGARLTFATVVPPFGAGLLLGPDVPAQVAQHVLEAERAGVDVARRRLEDLAGRARARGVEATAVVATDGDDVAEQLARTAQGRFADLVVACTHARRGVRRFLLGSVAERLVRLVDAPVLLVRPPWGVELDELGKRIG